jgi:hypothetical protein
MILFNIMHKHILGQATRNLLERARLIHVCECVNAIMHGYNATTYVFCVKSILIEVGPLRLDLYRKIFIIS